MREKNFMQIQEFSRLTGIRRENLRFYDQIGLLRPDLRGENGYRYYTRRQLGSAYLISDLRELGVGLEEIKAYSAARSPDRMLALFARQQQRLQAEIDRLRDIQESMRLRVAMVQDALSHGEDALVLEEREREPLFLCPPPPVGTSDEDAVFLAYDHAETHGVNLGYPFGAVYPTTALDPAHPGPPCRYYFKTRRRRNNWKPAGLYAVAYRRCALQRTDELLPSLIDFIRAQGLTPLEYAYGECLLDEMAVQDAQRYAVCLEIPVTRA